MIALLTGKLAYRSPEKVIIDVNGVGYRLLVPLSTYYKLPETGEVQLQIHTHVKEDAINLFGFATNAEKDLFVMLLSVSGVGPKLAITILSHMPATELALALSLGDAPSLIAIPGIGKKSAERLILELQDKAAAYAVDAAITPTDAKLAPVNDSHQDAISALVNLGYKETFAKQALQKVNLPINTPLEKVLKAALQVLLK